MSKADNNDEAAGEQLNHEKDRRLSVLLFFSGLLFAWHCLSLVSRQDDPQAVSWRYFDELLDDSVKIPVMRQELVAQNQAGFSGKHPRLDYLLGEPMAVNKADRQTLELLPEIGPGLASRIVDYREQHGPFTSMQSLEQVQGIGPVLARKLDRFFAYTP